MRQKTPVNSDPLSDVSAAGPSQARASVSFMINLVGPFQPCAFSMILCEGLHSVVGDKDSEA